MKKILTSWFTDPASSTVGGCLRCSSSSPARARWNWASSRTRGCPSCWWAAGGTRRPARSTDPGLVPTFLFRPTIETADILEFKWNHINQSLNTTDNPGVQTGGRQHLSSQNFSRETALIFTEFLEGDSRETALIFTEFLEGDSTYLHRISRGRLEGDSTSDLHRMARARLESQVITYPSQNLSRKMLKGDSTYLPQPSST